MMSVLKSLLDVGVVQKSARATANWIDLQWSLIDRDLRLVAPRARGQLLDVGCGDKPYEHLFTPFVDRYVGIEHEATFGATHAAHRDKGPDVYYDGVRLPFDDASFDTVLSVQVLEHTPEPQALLDEMARVLRPNGILIINVPFSFRLHEEPHDYFRYSPHGLRDMCARSGLRVTEMVAQGSVWSVIGHKLNSFLAFRVARLGGVTQALGKLNHEATRAEPLRIWSLPFVLPAMGTVSALARVLDRALHDPTEALSFLAIATRS